MAPIRPEACDVVILCGGLGTRLREVVSDRPKPMADIEGVPFLSLLVEHLASFGFRRFVLCIGHQADVIESHFRPGAGDISIALSREESPLGTGGALWNAKGEIRTDTFVALNGDSFCPVDYASFLAVHARRPGSATIAVTPVGNASDYGTVHVAENGRVDSFGEKRPGEGLVNAGVYALGKMLLDDCEWPMPFSMELDVFPRLAEAGALSAWTTEGPLLDIGTAERYREAQSRLIPLMRYHPPSPSPSVRE